MVRRRYVIAAIIGAILSGLWLGFWAAEKTLPSDVLHESRYRDTDDLTSEESTVWNRAMWLIAAKALVDDGLVYATWGAVAGIVFLFIVDQSKKTKEIEAHDRSVSEQPVSLIL